MIGYLLTVIKKEKFKNYVGQRGGEWACGLGLAMVDLLGKEGENWGGGVKQTLSGYVA